MAFGACMKKGNLRKSNKHTFLKLLRVEEKVIFLPILFFPLKQKTDTCKMAYGTLFCDKYSRLYDFLKNGIFRLLFFDSAFPARARYRSSLKGSKRVGSVRFADNKRVGSVRFRSGAAEGGEAEKPDRPNPFINLQT